jgi:hypothetical protein
MQYGMLSLHVAPAKLVQSSGAAGIAGQPLNRSLCATLLCSSVL